MNFDLFHFSNPIYLLLLILIPIISILYLKFFRNEHHRNIENFADSHLVPHILLQNNSNRFSIYRSILLASIIWILMVVAMAGPRWGYKEFKIFTQSKNLVILMDLSSSMKFNDIKPSRVNKMKQEIEDLLKFNKNIKIGLAGFAADAHIIVPITNDMKTIKHFLPFIDTDLVYIQGTRITPALKLAHRMLDSENTLSKHILLITDGGFEDDYSVTIDELKKNNIKLSCMGIGSKKGNGYEKDRLIAMAHATDGQYIISDFRDDNSKKFIDFIDNGANDQSIMQDQTIKQWDEKFYLFLLPLIILFFPWFKRGHIVPILIFIIITSSATITFAKNNNSYSNNSYSNIIENFFLNDQQQAKKEIENGITPNQKDGSFDDPYQKAVVLYKQNNFAEAEKFFKKVVNPEDKIDSLYNLGNSQAFQYKTQEAIKTYEELLKILPSHDKAKHNLEIVKKIDKNMKAKKNQKNNTPNKEDHDDKNKTQSQQNDNNSGEDTDIKNENSPKKKNDKKETDNDNKKNINQEQNNDKSDKNNKDNNPQSKNKSQNESKSTKLTEQKKSNIDEEKGRQNDNNRSELDKKSDILLGRFSNDLKEFLKIQFYIESMRNKTKPSNNPL